MPLSAVEQQFAQEGFVVVRSLFSPAEVAQISSEFDHLLEQGCYGIQVADDDAAVAASLMGPEQGYSGKYRDDLTGQLLKDVLVEEARAKELLYFHSKGVWMKVPKSSA